MATNSAVTALSVFIAVTLMCTSLSQHCHYHCCHNAVLGFAATMLYSFSLSQCCAHRCLTAVGFHLCIEYNMTCTHTIIRTSSNHVVIEVLSTLFWRFLRSAVIIVPKLHFITFDAKLWYLQRNKKNQTERNSYNRYTLCWQREAI